MTDAAAAKHWLHGLCAPDRDGPHPLHGDWIHRPWVLGDAAGCEWTVAADRVRLVALRGRHADAGDASPRASKALGRFLKPPQAGETFVWGEFRAWVGPVPVPETCPECKGDGKWRADPEELAWAEHEGVTLPPSEHCDLCGGSGVSPSPPLREVLLCGVSADASLLARALDAVGRAFGNVTDPDDLVEVCLASLYKPGTSPFLSDRGVDLEGQVTVRNAGEPLWAVTLMPLVGDTADDARADPATPRWPPGKNAER